MRHLKTKVVPQVVIRFGAQPVSKPLSLFLQACNPKIVIAVDESPIFRDSLQVADTPYSSWCKFSVGSNE